MPCLQLPNMTFLPFVSLAAVFSAATATASIVGTNSDSATRYLNSTSLPRQAQIIDSADFASIESVLPSSEYNGITEWVPPGTTRQGLKDRPFLVFDPEFLEIIGSDPKLAIIAETEKDPLFHEAVVWIPATDEVFFAQNAGAPDAGTGLNKSSIVQKVSVSEALQVASGNKTGHVKVETVSSNPPVINPNGEGMGNKTASALYSVNPLPPYNATILVNNFYGRQFNSLNDIGVNPRNSHIYFTDPLYAYFQDFRPPPALPVQVYKFNPETKAIQVVASEFDQANGKLYIPIYHETGITFSPDGEFVYVTDSGAHHGFRGFDPSRPSTIYRFNVAEDGTFENRKTFAYVDNGVPDGIHCDSKGNVYVGCGDGVHVFNPSGKLLGKIFTDGGAANFQFVGDGKMVICAETRLYLALIAAKAAPIN
ncbi:Gluconolactonase [Beauveria bassiana]|nr:Gluconolactonase [Beauveria bassiana]